MIEINKENVEELWELYEDFVDDFRKNNYSDAVPKYFEDFVYDDVVQCQNCMEYKRDKDMGTSELALQDEICDDCMFNGYGQ